MKDFIYSFYNITASSIDRYLQFNGWIRNYNFANRNMMVYTSKNNRQKTLAIPASEEFEDFDDADEDIEDDDTAVDDDTYIFPNSDTEYLTKSDLSGMSKSEINLAKNELYARHGRKFKSKELQEYFESKDWYVPKYSPKQWDKKGDTFFFNKYEIKNRDLLKKYENK